MLSVTIKSIMLNVVMLSVIMLNVIMLNVMAPQLQEVVTNSDISEKRGKLVAFSKRNKKFLKRKRTSLPRFQ